MSMYVIAMWVFYANDVWTLIKNQDQGHMQHLILCLDGVLCLGDVWILVLCLDDVQYVILRPDGVVFVQTMSRS